VPKRDRESGEHEESEFTPLPAGRHGLPRDYVVENQRARLFVGIVRAVALRGYNAATITAIADAASVSRHTFYDNFENKEQCFLAAYSRVVEDLEAEMVAAAEPLTEWPEQVRAAIDALLEFFAQEPDLARFFWLEPLGGGELIVTRHREAVGALIDLLTADRPSKPAVPPLSKTAQEAVVGGIVSLISKQVSSGEVSRLAELLPDLLELVLAPYIGSAAAERFAADRS
jgi:AcrR family transcriptional regulator